ncbi:hypothetical protein T266_17450 [Pseudomonas aeruginosa VRFPA05]|nr:hypothetical protein T266_17450 [Pseudomonas aeruginosa VRFPA05]
MPTEVDFEFELPVANRVVGMVSIAKGHTSIKGGIRVKSWVAKSINTLKACCAFSNQRQWDGMSLVSRQPFNPSPELVYLNRPGKLVIFRAGIKVKTLRIMIIEPVRQYTLGVSDEYN